LVNRELVAVAALDFFAVREPDYKHEIVLSIDRLLGRESGGS